MQAKVICKADMYPLKYKHLKTFIDNQRIFKEAYKNCLIELNLVSTRMKAARNW